MPDDKELTSLAGETDFKPNSHTNKHIVLTAMNHVKERWRMGGEYVTEDRL